MRRLALLLGGAVIVAGLALPVLMDAAIKPKPAEATLFGCNNYAEVQTHWALSASICAEHGSGWYRSNVRMWVTDLDTGLDVASNFGIYDQELYYYCYDGNGCNLYDTVDNTGYIGVLLATSWGDNIGCPGASNQGEIHVLKIQWRPGGAGHNLYTSYIDAAYEPDHIAFNSSC